MTYSEKSWGKSPKTIATLDLPHRSSQSLDQQPTMFVGKTRWISTQVKRCTWLAAEQLVHCNLISSCHPGLIKVRTPMIRMRLGSWHTGWSLIGGIHKVDEKTESHHS